MSHKNRTCSKGSGDPVPPCAEEDLLPLRDGVGGVLDEGTEAIPNACVAVRTTRKKQGGRRDGKGSRASKRKTTTRNTPTGDLGPTNASSDDGDAAKKIVANWFNDHQTSFHQMPRGRVLPRFPSVLITLRHHKESCCWSCACDSSHRTLFILSTFWHKEKSEHQVQHQQKQKTKNNIFCSDTPEEVDGEGGRRGEAS